MLFVEVIIPLRVKGIYTYAVPDKYVGSVAVGDIVVVPFGKKYWYSGVVYSLHSAESEKEYRVKDVDRLVDKGFSLSTSHLKFLTWLSEYYMAPLGMVIQAALPVALRLDCDTSLSLVDEYMEELPKEMVFSADEMEMIEEFRAWRLKHDVGRQVEINESTYSGGVMPMEQLYRTGKVGPDRIAVARSLMLKGILEIGVSRYCIYKPKWERLVRWTRVFTDQELGEALDGLGRAPAQYKMLIKWIQYTMEHQVTYLSRKEFASEIGDSSAVLKALCERGFLEVVRKEISRLEVNEEKIQELHSLSEPQAEAIARVRDFFQKKDCVLLRGVTSSGKTEVYIHLIEEVLKRGEQVLYLLPEIALTVQIVKRLRRVFGDQVGVYHSGMSEGARAEMWRKQNGDHPYPVILGVRSSVFLPYRHLGLVIVDEEHEGSYKQQSPDPRYHGRDVAILLGKMNGAKVLLGSATPSFESYQNALLGKYGFVELTTRYGEVMMPELVFVDMKEYRRKKLMKEHFTPVLLEEMKRVLEEGNQVILFHNRRGYSTFLRCDFCGAVLKCKNCDVTMTYHSYQNRLNCHYCGSLREIPTACEACGQGHYKYMTPGTERIEEEVIQFFPKARVARVDTDVMGDKVKFRKLIEDFENGKVDVLVGTQMIAKGLDFERVKLVGVMDCDSLMGFSDFRAEERAYNMLMQVSGRSGRRGERGKVVFQVWDVQNRLFSWVAGENYHTFFTSLMQERELFRYPPFFRLILVELRHRDARALRDAANELAREYRMTLEKRVCGPAEPEINRIQKMYRIQLLVKAEQGISLSKLKSFLGKKFDELYSTGKMKGVSIHFDVDPL